MNADCCVFKFLRRSVEGKYLMRFQTETALFSNSTERRGVDRKYLMRFQSETSALKLIRRSADNKHLKPFQSETSVLKC